jgi:hypothetical protein
MRRLYSIKGGAGEQLSLMKFAFLIYKFSLYVLFRAQHRVIVEQHYFAPKPHFKERP